VPLLSWDSFPRGLSRTPEESGKRPGGHDRSGTQPSHRGPRGEPAINAVNHGDAILPRVSINIEGKEVVALIDTGATHNMIRRGAVVGQVKLLYQPAQLQTATVHSQARIEGTQELRCTLGKVHFQSKFLVVDRLVETVVLGYEFM
jgi:hypothetical protein